MAEQIKSVSRILHFRNISGLLFLSVLPFRISYTDSRLTILRRKSKRYSVKSGLSVSLYLHISRLCRMRGIEHYILRRNNYDKVLGKENNRIGKISDYFRYCHDRADGSFFAVLRRQSAGILSLFKR